MTEYERFQCTVTNNEIYNGRIFDQLCRMETTEVVNKLNKLNKLEKENERLKSICQDHHEHAIDFKADCVRLEKENELLKLQLQNTSDQRNEFYRAARENANHVGKLKKENKQLKQQSNSVYEIVKEYAISHHCISTMRMLKKIEKVMWND